MNIKIGDTVQVIDKSPLLFGALKVIDIIGDNAKCVYYLLDKDLNGDERPTSLTPTEGLFPLKNLTLIQ
jgi:hypothetical protein